MKKIFETPVIEKIDFELSDSTMCTSSCLMSDYGTFDQVTQSQLGSMTE